MARAQHSAKGRESSVTRDNYRDSRNYVRESPYCSYRAAHGARRAHGCDALPPAGRYAPRHDHEQGSLSTFGIQAWNIQGAYGHYRNVRRSEGPDRSSSHETKTADGHRPWRTRLLLDLAVDRRLGSPAHPHADLHRHSPSAARTRPSNETVPIPSTPRPDRVRPGLPW